MKSKGKCQYCEEYKPTTNIENKLPLLFLNTNFRSRYIICDDCLSKLKKDKSLTSKDGQCTVVIA